MTYAKLRAEKLRAANMTSIEETRDFSETASALLIERRQIRALLDLLDVPSCPNHPEGGYKIRCPRCLQRHIIIRTLGKHHRIYWYCLNRQCSTHSDPRLAKNLVGLVRLLSDDSLPDALQTIAEFLGFDSPADVLRLPVPERPFPGRTLADRLHTPGSRLAAPR